MKIPLVESLAWIVGSTLFVTGGTYSALNAHFKTEQKKLVDPNYKIARIIQTGPQKEALNSVYLAELMQISADMPVSIAKFDPTAAEKRILSSPVIQEAKVKIIEPDTVHVDYTVRQPIAWLYDFENAAIDEAAVPFPISPFFSSKNLPEIYLGIDRIEWNKPIHCKQVDLALKILKLVAFPVRRLDVSKAFADTYGHREIVLITEDGGITRALRLSLNNYPQELGNYLTLRDSLPATPQVIDMRIPSLAFIQEKKE